MSIISLLICAIYFCGTFINTTIGAGLDSIIASDVFSAHEVSADAFNLEDEEIEFQSIAPNIRSRHHPLFLCSKINALRDLRSYIHEISGAPLKSIRTAVIRKSANLACLLLDTSVLIPVYDIRTNFTFSRHIFPDVLKIDRSVLSYLERKKMDDKSSHTIPVHHDGGSKFHHRSVNYWDMETDSHGRDLIELVIEFSPFAMGHKSSREVGLKFFQLSVSAASDEPFLPTKSRNWNRIMAEAVKMSELNDLECEIPETVVIEYFHTGVRLRNMVEVTYSCIVLHVLKASQSKDVLRVSIGTKSQVVNFEARGMVETGKGGHEPYHKLGLTGKGQVCGLADTGVDDMSCFFRDDSNAYATQYTTRSGDVETQRRKVIQYVGAADSSDYEGGHGTHVAGTLLGSSRSDFQNMDGIAPDAKLAFFDIGKGERLTVPSLFDVVFPAAHKAGARVHSNSWGASYLHSYNYNSYDVDRYTFEHPDFLVVTAAGNYGENGPLTIITPADAKNGIAVGALEKHDPLSDLPLQELTVAWFSSRGPAAGGRFKPDVLAPGSVIMSSFAGPEGSAGKETCATVAMMGTSMAAPVVAGTAILVRQYFTDPKFWAANCNARYKSCSDGAFSPTGYLLKALLIHSTEAATQYSVSSFNFRTAVPAKKLYFTPDSEQGYGAVRLTNLLPLPRGDGLSSEVDLLVWDSVALSQHATLRWEVSVTSDAHPLKVTIAWYDPPAVFALAAVLLLHDIDLFVIDPGGVTHYGNGIWGGDELNPNERVIIDTPTCVSSNCIYRVYVRTHALPEADRQDVALVVTCAGVASGPYLEITPQDYRAPRASTTVREAKEGGSGRASEESQPQHGYDNLKSDASAVPLDDKAVESEEGAPIESDEGPSGPLFPVPATAGSVEAPVEVTVRVSVNISLQPNRFYSIRSRVQCIVNDSAVVSVSVSKDVYLLPAVLSSPVSEQQHLRTTIRADTADNAYGLRLEWFRETNPISASIAESPATTSEDDVANGTSTERLIRRSPERAKAGNSSDYHFVVSLIGKKGRWTYLLKHSATTAARLQVDELVCISGVSPVQLSGKKGVPEPQSWQDSSYRGGLKFSREYVWADVVLSGDEYWETSRVFADYWVLNRIDVKVSFNPISPLPNRFSTVSDLILGILAPNGVKLVVSGTPDGLRWPFDWYRLENGTFTATFYVSDENCAGAGEWTFGFRNSYSLSGDMSYGIGVTMYMSSAPLPNQYALPSAAPTLTPSRFVSTSTLYRRVVNIPPWTMLGVRPSERGGVVQDQVQLASLPISDGYLREVHIALQFQDLDSSRHRIPYIDGSTAWLFTVVVTDPRGYSVQIGGRDFWSPRDRFFKTDWPLVWAATFPDGHVFSASRDLSAAGLNGMGSWTVSATMGYPEAVTPKTFSGNITLLFATTPDWPLTASAPRTEASALGLSLAVITAVATFGTLLVLLQRQRLRRTRYVVLK